MQESLTSLRDDALDRGRPRSPKETVGPKRASSLCPAKSKLVPFPEFSDLSQEKREEEEEVEEDGFQRTR